VWLKSLRIGAVSPRLIASFLVMPFFALSAYGSTLPRIEISVLADRSTVEFFGSVEAAREAIEARVRKASRLYREQLGIELTVAHMEIPENVDLDPFDPDLDADEILDALIESRTWRPELRTTDATLLITARDMRTANGRLGGYAATGTLCTRDAAFVVRVMDPETDPRTLAHELAHVLGVGHDGEWPCAHENPDGWLMAATDNDNHRFSTCTLRTARELIAWRLPCRTPLPTDLRTASHLSQGG